MRQEEVACNLCGSSHRQPLFERADDLTGDPQPHRLVRCRGCGLQYVSPRPAAEEIARFYTPQFVSYQFVLAGPGASLRDRAVDAITRSAARQRVRLLEATAKLGPDTRVLDLGCGKGVFLHHLRQRHGCDVTGVDFEAEAVRYCRDELGLRAIQGGAADLSQLAPGFDIVTLWHFLEHEFDPLAALQAAHRLLAADGRLVVEVPNADSLENAVFGERSYLYDLPRHLYHFTPATLRALLERAGFEVERQRFTCLAGGWVGSLQNVVGGGRVYRRLREHVGTFMLLAQLALPLDWLSARAGRGSILTVVARKRTSAAGG
jgi:SAM-dependent methyltransferase